MLYNVLFPHGKRIAFIGQRGVPPDFIGTSGIEFYSYHHMRKLIKKGYQVRAYVRRWAYLSNKLSTGILIIRIPGINSKHLDTVTYALAASIHACLTDIDIVWYQGIGPALFSFLPRLYGKRVITTIHAADWQRKKWGWATKNILFAAARISFLCSHVVTCVSKNLTKSLSATYGLPIILDRMNLQKKARVRPRLITQRYNLKPKKYVIYIGRFVPEKRLEWLIAASKQISIPVVLAGGSSHSDCYVKKLRALSADTNVKFLPYVFGREKNELLSNARAFVLPSSLEGYPVSVVEALEHGTSCLVGDFLKGEYSRQLSRIHYFKTDNYNDFLIKLERLITT